MLIRPRLVTRNRRPRIQSREPRLCRQNFPRSNRSRRRREPSGATQAALLKIRTFLHLGKLRSKSRELLVASKAKTSRLTPLMMTILPFVSSSTSFLTHLERKKKKEDWNYLKQTLHMDQKMMTFHEKVDKIVEEEEQLKNKHLEYLKEAANLLTQEGELISNVQGIGQEDYDIDEYVDKMEHIIQRNLEIYMDLQRRMQKFRKHLQEEEAAHKEVTGSGPGAFAL